jgi:hypothetical protein
MRSRCRTSTRASKSRCVRRHTSAMKVADRADGRISARRHATEASGQPLARLLLQHFAIDSTSPSELATLRGAGQSTGIFTEKFPRRPVQCNKSAN